MRYIHEQRAATTEHQCTLVAHTGAQHSKVLQMSDGFYLTGGLVRTAMDAIATSQGRLLPANSTRLGRRARRGPESRAGVATPLDAVAATIKLT